MGTAISYFSIRPQLVRGILVPFRSVNATYSSCDIHKSTKDLALGAPINGICSIDIVVLNVKHRSDACLMELRSQFSEQRVPRLKASLSFWRKVFGTYAFSNLYGDVTERPTLPPVEPPLVIHRSGNNAQVSGPYRARGGCNPWAARP